MIPDSNMIAAFAIAAFLTGCANPPVVEAVRPPATAGALSSPHVQHEAKLYVLNISGPTVFSSNQDFTDNGTVIASLPRQTYTTLRISAGHHEFRFPAFPQGKRVAKLNAEKGRTYFLAAGYYPSRSWALPFGGGPMTLSLLPQGDAIDLLKEMKPQ